MNEYKWTLREIKTKQKHCQWVNIVLLRWPFCNLFYLSSLGWLINKILPSPIYNLNNSTIYYIAHNLYSSNRLDTLYFCQIQFTYGHYRLYLRKGYCAAIWCHYVARFLNGFETKTNEFKVGGKQWQLWSLCVKSPCWPEVSLAAAAPKWAVAKWSYAGKEAACN